MSYMFKFSERDDGLTTEEGVVADHLFSATCAWAELPVQHEDDTREFEYHVHMLQGLLTMRIARREYPDGWSNAEPQDPPPVRSEWYSRGV